MPFVAKTRAKIDQFVVEKDPAYKDKAWKQCSPDVLDLAQNLLKKNPSERLSIDEILNHSWLREDAKDEIQPDVAKGKKQKKAKVVYLKRCVLK